MMPNAGHRTAGAATTPLRKPSGFSLAGRAAVRLVLWFLTVSFAAAAQGWISGDQAKSSAEPARMEDALREAFADPYGFYDRGGHKELVTLVEEHTDASFAVAAPGELESLITSAEENTNAVLLFVYNLLLSVQDRQSHPEKSCAALAAAAGTLFKQLDEPEAALALNRAALRRSCPDAADAIRRVEEYLGTDRPIALLLRERWYNEDEKQRVLYARALERALDAHPSTALRVDAMQRIGDVYYDLKKFRSMREWYRAVAATDSTLLRETTVGIRLEEAAKRIVRQNLIILFMACYAAAGTVLAVRIIRSWRTFDAGGFFKRLGAFLALYLLAAAAVFFIDARLFPAEVGNLTFGGEYPYPVTRPAVPLGAMDISFFPMPVIILAVGFIPVLLGALYISFRKRFSRWLVSAFVLLTTGVLWSHFVLATAFDQFMSPIGIFTKGRIFYNGELEKLLVENPAKVLKANPGFMNEDNMDLRAFLKDNFPGGFPPPR